jgi:hypothetical protein
MKTEVIIGSWNISQYVSSVSIELSDGLTSTYEYTGKVYFKRRYWFAGILEKFHELNASNPSVYLSDGSKARRIKQAHIVKKEYHLEISHTYSWNLNNFPPVINDRDWHVAQIAPAFGIGVDLANGADIMVHGAFRGEIDGVFIEPIDGEDNAD